MPPVWEARIWDLIITTLSVVLGGGLVGLWIDWRRHQRELKQWQLQDQQLQIDIPRAEMAVTLWAIHEDMSDADKVPIYENKLENTVEEIVLAVEFVIRNTTPGEIIITSYGVSIVGVPAGQDVIRYYNLEHMDLISVDDIGSTKLKPYATLPRLALLVGQFGKNRRLESAPTTLSVEATTSSGKVVQEKTTINVVKGIPEDIVLSFDGELHPKKYVEKISPEPSEEIVEQEDNIPF